MKTRSSTSVQDLKKKRHMKKNKNIKFECDKNFTECQFHMIYPHAHNENRIILFLIETFIKE